MSKNIHIVFKKTLTYPFVNKYGEVSMRNHEDGMTLAEAVLYRAIYTQQGITKDVAAATVNEICGKNFSRQAYDKKESHISIKVYEDILLDLIACYNSVCDIYNGSCIAVDGTYNNDVLTSEMLNMGIYNVTHGVPIDIKCYGKENKNREVSSITEYIQDNQDIFKNNILVGDRIYFTYDFMDFLIENDIKFIIRVKGQADYLTGAKKIKSDMKKYRKMINVKNNTRVVKHNDVYAREIYAGDGKNRKMKHNVVFRRSCVFVTNLTDDDKFPDDKIDALYRSRWDIEVFFKLLKQNFKFQHLKEKSKINNKKMYVWELIIMYITKIIEYTYKKEYPLKKDKNKKYDINHSHLIKGVFRTLLSDIIRGKSIHKKLKNFYRSNIKIIQNKINRTFPREAKKPYCKWNTRGYLERAKWRQIINAIKTNNVHTLDKNLKVIAGTIISIDGKEYK